jgi:N-acetylated-alpha-linked acidic dipeptidase
MVQAHEEDKHNAATDSHGGGLPLRPIGSGSDFTPFTHHLGIASLSLQYTGEEDQSGVYHSLYDSFDHYLRFGDPGLVYGVLLAETCGHLILRTANADILPLQFTDFADALENYRGEVHRLAEDLRKRSEELSALLDQRAYELAADPTRPVKAPEREPEVPYLNFAPMDNAVARLRKGAASYDDAFRRMMASNALPSGLHRLALNEQLQGIEQALADARGLPGRPWYRNLVYAPGLLTGYAAKTLPGVREALEGSRYGEANEYVLMTAGVIDAYAARVEGATQLLIQDEPQRRF